MKHYKEQLSEFVNHEPAHEERRQIAEHLLQCAECRAEHDEIKFGAALGGALVPQDAPEKLWQEIENSLDDRREKAVVFPDFAFFSLRALIGTAAFLIVGAVGAFLYFQAARSDSPQIAGNEPAIENSRPDSPANVAINSNQPQTAAADPANPSAPVKSALTAAWNVETLAGMPRINDALAGEKLAVGEILETDAVSRARVEVADIGSVEIAPNSRVKLVHTRTTEHRLALEKGALKAQILAPPRLFIVDTPSGTAVDLGCEYTLEVDAAGNTRLHVTSGFVALEDERYESIVPAGAIAVTRKGKGVGTPFADDSSAALQRALYRFDFEDGGAAALETVIKEADLYDSITLWHLLSRVEMPARAKVFDALAARVKPPRKVSRAGILRLDPRMLDAWWTRIETVWFGE